MVRSRIILTSSLALLLVVLLASSASAFDGRRKGFVLGGGLGFAPDASWDADTDIIPHFKDNGPGVALHLIIGYAWDEHNMIVYEGNVAGRQTEIGPINVRIAQGFNGASWYHYFGPRGRSFFTAA